jgi:hypothetical protein
MCAASNLKYESFLNVERDSKQLAGFIQSHMPACGQRTHSPTWLVSIIVAAIVLLTATPVASDNASQREAATSVNSGDYFQIPADLFLHGHSLARHSEQIRSSKQPAHRVKTADGWRTSSEAQLVSIDQKLITDSFFYHNLINGAVTNISSIFETVSDTVYFDQVLSATSVSCNANLVSIMFNSSMLDGYPKNVLSFGSKCAHYAPGVRVTGGNAFFCRSPSDSTAHLFREIISVVSCVEDPASGGHALFLTLNTVDANPLTFYNSISDYNINGSMALIPKRLVRPNSKVNFFELSRQLWKERRAEVHLRGACDGVMTIDGFCSDLTGIGTGTAYVGLQAQKSARSSSLCFFSVSFISSCRTIMRCVIYCRRECTLKSFCSIRSFQLQL